MVILCNPALLPGGKMKINALEAENLNFKRYLYEKKNKKIITTAGSIR